MTSLLTQGVQQMSQQNAPNSATITLDEVFKAMQHWRKNKKDYSGVGIPDKIWSSIFQLEHNGYSASELKRCFTLNSKQYNLKKKQLSQSNDDSDTPVVTKNNQNEPDRAEETVSFCEATVAPTHQSDIPSLEVATSDTKKALLQIKSTNNPVESYLDMTTIIVECIRPDGYRLNIHTTTESLDKVMLAFFHEGVTPS